jgi:uncharacterized protein YkwD
MTAGSARTAAFLPSVLFAAGAVLLATGCGATSTTSPSGASEPAPDLAFCVSESNRARATVALPPLVESAALESFAAAGAQADHEANLPHGHFEGHMDGTAFAENEQLRWSKTGSVQQLMKEGVAAYVAEGLAGGHYQNLMGPYTQLGCGVYASGSLVTIVQDFR